MKSSVSDFNSKSDVNLVTPWRSMYIGAFLAISTNIQYSIFFSTIWPYLQIIDPTVTVEYFSYVVGAYAIGNIICSPAFGWWSNKLKGITIPLYIGLVCQLVGNALYIILSQMSSGQKELMLVSRLITGVGTSSVSLLRSYAATASLDKDRSKAVSLISGGMAFGIIMGPSFNILFSPLSYPGINLFGFIDINIYTMPAILAVITNAGSILLINIFFREKYVGLANESSDKSSDKIIIVPPFDRQAVAIAFMTRFTQMFLYASLSTMGPIMAMMMFDLTKAETIQTISIAQGIQGTAALIVYILFISADIGKYGKTRRNVMIGIMILTVFHFITYPYPFYKGQVTMYASSKLENLNSSTELIGCDTDKFTWCEHLSPINIYLYFGAYSLCFGTAFPTVNSFINTLFSRILGPRRQGT
uniref:MFS domain-containing protein n=1 Tax=Rhabditophanes sp. KR3021 TaxID=114890 RepID=A0AC35TVN6_9BILA